MWTSKRSTEETLEILRDLSAQCNELGGPLTHEVFQLVCARDFTAVVDFHFDYGSYNMSQTDDLVYARQIQAFYSKLACLPLPGVNKREAAVKKFMEAEEQCLWTNRKLAYLRAKPHLRSSAAHSILHRASVKIKGILGDVPPISDLNCSFGPGACTNVKGRDANPRVKLSVQLQCSNELSPTVGEFLETFPLWAEAHATKVCEDHLIVWCDVVPGKLMFVPKNAKTDRSIMIEPILNGFFQKGIGTYMKDRLFRAGVDLRDQSRNQKLARKGSCNGLYPGMGIATMDLSSASDCVSRELVAELLPPEWFDLLDRSRTGDAIINGEQIRLEKFSSMGNAYTFELESLIFYSIAYAVCTHLHISTKDVNVYGDDIVVPSRAFPLLSEILQELGFSINLEKSFSTGPFRESCGADYFYGFDIRPLYQKSPVSDQTLYASHNWFVRHGEFKLAKAVLCHITTNTPPLWGPDGYGDGHLIGTHDLRRTRKLVRSGWDGGVFDTYSLKSKHNMKVCDGDKVLPVYSVYVRSGAETETDPFVVRGSNGYQKVSIYTLRRDVFPRS